MLDWLEYTLYSFSICFLIFIVPGQIFFLSLNEGMKSIRNGLLMLLGVVTAQFFLIILLEIGAIYLLNKYIFFINIVGTLILIWLGFSAIYSSIKGIKTSITKSSYQSSYVRGLFLTLFNPPFIIWFITVGFSLLNKGIETLGNIAHLIFVFSIIGGSVIVSLILIFLAAYSRKPFGEKGLRFLSFFSGLAFIILAFKLLL
ncbi:MAG: LysE family transporter [Nitrososphaerota archaeon]